MKRLDAAVLLLLAIAGSAGAQAPMRVPPAGMTVTGQVRERGLHGGQRAQSAEFDQFDEVIRIDTARNAADGRRLSLSAGNRFGAFTIGSTGRLTDYAAAFRPVERRPTEALP